MMRAPNLNARCRAKAQRELIWKSCAVYDSEVTTVGYDAAPRLNPCKSGEFADNPL